MCPTGGRRRRSPISCPDKFRSAFTTTAGVTDLVESGKLNLLATFGAERDEQFPNTPTPTEAGYPSVVVVGWAGLLAPAGTPPQIVNKLYAGMAKALAMPDVKDAILHQGSKAVSSRVPEDFARYIKSEIDEIPPRHQGRRPRRIAVSGCPTSRRPIASAC